MTIKARGVAACLFSFIILALTGIGASAQTPTKSIKDQLVGHWRLVSVAINGAEPYGAQPKGSMFLDAGGHYAVIVISAGNARDISYFGGYTVDEAAKTVTMHIEASSRPAAVGRDETRQVAFKGNDLILENLRTPASRPRFGSIALTWARDD